MRKAKKIKIKNQTLTREEPNNNKRIYGNYPIMVFLISSQFISDTQCMIAGLATSQNWEKENPAAGGVTPGQWPGHPDSHPKCGRWAACYTKESTGR